MMGLLCVALGFYIAWRFIVKPFWLITSPEAIEHLRTDAAARRMQREREARRRLGER